MDEFAPPRDAAVSLPHPQHCPPWCIDYQHDDVDPPYLALHRSPPAIVTLYDEGCDVVHAQVRAAFWDKAPDWIGTDPADLERPHVEVGIPDSGDMQLYLNPGQARSFAAALIRAADAADTEAFYPGPTGPARYDLDRHVRQCAVTAGLMPRHRSAWMGRGCPTVGHQP